MLTLSGPRSKGWQTLFSRYDEYRNALDALKIELGLSPSVPILPDAKATGVFKEVFDSLYDWQRRSDRELRKPVQIINELPEPGDIILNGQGILDAVTPFPDRWEEIIAKVYPLVLEKRVQSAKGALAEDNRIHLELQTRRRVRYLAGLRRSYADVKRRYYVATLVMDQSLEHLFRPASRADASRSLFLGRYIQAAGDITLIKDELIELWTTFRTSALRFIATWVCFPTPIGNRSTRIWSRRGPCSRKAS